MKSVIVNAITLAILLPIAGRWNWMRAWILVAIMCVLQLAVLLGVYRKYPDLAKERSRLQPGTKSWDKPIVAGATLVAPLAMYVLAALDARHGWSDISGGPALAGFLLCTAGGLLTLDAMLANRYFAATVRIQKDRGQRVVDAGPYAIVRHPGYVGMIAFDLGVPLALGSWWAAIPAGIAILLFLLRTALEDRLLRAELPGYTDYAARVHSRLVPGIW